MRTQDRGPARRLRGGPTAGRSNRERKQARERLPPGSVRVNANMSGRINDTALFHRSLRNSAPPNSAQ